MKDIALLIPTHPPHYPYIYALLNKFKEYQISMTVHLVFSSEADLDSFTMKDVIVPIVIKGPIQHASIITFKKFYGLKELIHSNYDYILCCDSEIDILPEYFTHDNIYGKLERIFQKKQIYASDAVGRDPTGRWITQITNRCAQLFPTAFNQLAELTNDFEYYFWWSDIPVYRRSDLADFFSKFDDSRLVHYHFDHMIYQMYLVLYHDFKFVNINTITKLGWSLEKLYRYDKDVFQNLTDLGYEFSWITKKLALCMPDDALRIYKPYMIYHLDRQHQTF